MRAYLIALLVFLGASRCIAQGTWTLLPDAPAGELDVLDSRHLLVFQKSGAIYLSGDSGATWLQRTFPANGRNTAHSAKRLSPSTILVCGGIVLDELHDIREYHSWTSSDSGKTWVDDIYTGVQEAGGLMIQGRTTNNWFYGMGRIDGYLGAHYVYDRNNRFKLSVGWQIPVISIDTYDSSAIAVAGLTKPFSILATHDTGGTWTTVGSLQDKPGYLRFADSGIAYLSIGAVLMRSSDFGSSWDTALQAPSKILDFQFKGSQGFLGLDGLDYIYATTDNGGSWFAQSIAGEQSIQQLFITADSIAYGRSVSGILRISGFSGAAKPVIHCNRIIDLGKLSRDTSFSYEVEIENVGRDTLWISSVSATSERISDIGSIAGDHLAPGSSGRIRFRYTQVGDKVDTTGLTITSNAESKNDVILIRSESKVLAAVLTETRLAVGVNIENGTLFITGYGLPENGNYQLLDVTGRIVDSGSIDHNQISVGHLRSGLYFVQFSHVSPNIKFIVE